MHLCIWCCETAAPSGGGSGVGGGDPNLKDLQVLNEPWLCAALL